MENPIHSRFLPLPLTKKLIEKGYNVQSFATFDDDGIAVNVFNYLMRASNYTMAFLYQDVVDWFRTEHDIHIIPQPILTRKYSFVVDRAFKAPIVTDELEYYEAFNIAIEKALELI